MLRLFPADEHKEQGMYCAYELVMKHNTPPSLVGNGFPRCDCELGFEFPTGTIPLSLMGVTSRQF